MAAGAGRVPVFLLTGFLGSGKTTLLNALLKRPEFANTAVIVNEFGEIGLDHFLIERSQDNVVLLEAGCLCCTIADSLHETLADLNFRKVRGDIPRFERVVIETTGLADPAPILNTLLGNRLVTDHYRLEGAIVTVDAQHALSQLDVHGESVKQVAVADRLVVTKLDMVAMPGPLRGRLAELNPRAEVVESREGEAALQAFAPIDACRIVADPPAGHDHAHSDHDHRADVYRHDAHVKAHCFVVDDPASWAGVAAWWRALTEACGDRLLRCKGLLRIRDTGEIVFVQGVQRVFHRPERLNQWPDEDHRSRLVCITRDVDGDVLRAALAALQLPPGSDPGIASLPESNLRKSQ
ncbi:MAG TPA: GTP-binding protein [Casimicrobiaceae bacterium]|jgi:G3E family GTPase